MKNCYHGDEWAQERGGTAATTGAGAASNGAGAAMSGAGMAWLTVLE